MGKERVGLKDLLKIGQNINTGVKTEEQTEAFSIVNLSVFDLEAHPRNFYSTTEQKEILDLKDSIELFGGVQQNLIVVRNAPEAQRKYKIIAGHKRNIASEMLVEEGKKKFEYVPCLIKNNLDEIVERILLIHTNSTIHQLSDWEKTEQLRQLKELLGEYKKLHKLPGRLQELLADTLNISPSQVARHERIDEKLIDEYKEEYKSGEVKFSTVAEIARLPEEEQRAAYQNNVKKLEEVEELHNTKRRKPEIAMKGDIKIITLPATKKTGKIEIKILYSGGKYYSGYDYQLCGSSSRGGGSAPSEEYGKAFDTEAEAIACAAKTIADQNPERDDVQKLLLRTGCMTENPVHEPEKPGFPQQENKAQPVENVEQEPETEEFMVPQQMPNPEHETVPEAIQEDSAPNYAFCIQAAEYVKGLLELKIEKSEMQKKFEVEKKNTKGIMRENAKIAYMNEVLKRVEQDLFDLSGESMFKDE